MKTTLRDNYLKNIKISKKDLQAINSKLNSIIVDANRKESNENKKMFFTYVIRFDEKGRSLFNFQEALKYYEDAKRIERFNFNIDCLQSYRNKMFGKSISIHFDNLNANNCRMVVQGDDSDWVDNTYSSLMDILLKAKNYNIIIRNPVTPFLVQVGGVVVGVLLSIKGAQWLEPKLNIQYSLPFAFVIIFLLFSNVWAYLYDVLLRCIDRLWPNVTFKEKQNNFIRVFHWAMNIVLGFVFLVGVKNVALFILNAVGSLFK